MPKTINVKADDIMNAGNFDINDDIMNAGDFDINDVLEPDLGY
jgi:hypothetical protein